MDKNTALASNQIKEFLTNQILASEEEISILGRSSSITSDVEGLLVDYLSRALISSFSAAST
jgi:hypothetical protein